MSAGTATPAPLLRVRDLSVTIAGPDGNRVRLVEGVSFDLESSGSLGLVGESGSGKTLTLKAIMGLLPRGARAEGSIQLNGTELTGKTERELAAVRGAQVSVVFQDPMSALNPVRRIGPQIAEAPRRHLGMNKGQARALTLELMSRVGLPDPATTARRYPHELSGGMRQRVMIAIALSCSPRLILCDEPTTALDVTVQAQVLRLLRSACQDLGTAMVFVSHDLAVIRQVCRDLAVMYSGRVVEIGPADAVFRDPRHSYTASLLRALPDVDRPSLPQPISGEPPHPQRPPAGCRFHPRCPDVAEACATWPSRLLPIDAGRPGHRSACLRAVAGPAVVRECADSGTASPSLSAARPEEAP